MNDVIKEIKKDRNYPYTAVLKDDPNSSFILWVFEEDKAYLMNDPKFTVIGIDENRLSPCRVKCIIHPEDPRGVKVDELLSKLFGESPLGGKR